LKKISIFANEKKRIMPTSANTSRKAILPFLFPKQTEDDVIREILSAEKSGDMTWDEFIMEQEKWEREHLK
jgi:hypothetical protein